jgi:pyridoxamine 5'-phosphate oxidase
VSRTEDHAATLTEDDAGDQPWPLFGRWLAEAEAAGLLEPNAMTLATADPAGRPSARMVLLRGWDDGGFTFFTNYDSRKGRELAANPWAALVFWWPALGRQVRAEGPVARVSAAESDAYFAARPRGSQLAAAASPQSRPIPDRRWLEDAVAELAVRLAGRNVPRPAHWGGFRLAPDAIEFWRRGEFRLHDRLRFERDGAAWRRERLAP